MIYREERRAVVDEILLDADIADDTELRATLLSMGSFASLPAPTPNAELAAMLAGPHDELSKRRWKRKHRAAVVGVAVVAAMGLGVSGVAAASSGFTRHPSFIDELIANLAPRGNAAPTALPTPDAPKVTTEEGRQVDPATVPAIVGPAEAEAPAASEAQASAQPDVVAPAANPAGQVPTAKPAVPGSSAAQDEAAKPAGSKPNTPAAKPAPVKPTNPAKPEPKEQDAKHGQGTKQGEGHGEQNERHPSFVEKLKEWLKAAG